MAKMKLIALKVEDKPGTVATVLSSLAEAEINILSVFGWAPQGVLELVVDNAGGAGAVLNKLGISFDEAEAEFVEMENRPGTLHKYLAQLAATGVNLRSLCGIGRGNDKGSCLVWTAQN